MNSFIKSTDLHFVFVDDASTDGTYEKLLALKQAHITVLQSKMNLGKANSIFLGVKSIEDKLSDSDTASYIDADLSVSIEELKRLLALYKKDEFLMGSRITNPDKKNVIIKRFYRYLYGRVFSKLINYFFNFNYYDTQCGAKIFNKLTIQQAFSAPFVSRWFIDIEILLRAKSISVREVPLDSWIHRSEGHIGIFSIFSILSDFFKIRRSY